ncbi:MAG: YqgE/AlgH family protein [Bacteroidales bacterium]|nr:YqgE/AlgH family protein [Bacteroidales bacterium]
MEKLIRIKSNDLKPASGRVLLAEPLMDEFWFGRSVVLLIDHTDEGTLGLVMNKLAGISVQQVLGHEAGMDSMIYVGGPVLPNHVYFIHTLGDKVPGSVKVMDGLYWGGEVETIREMMDMGVVQDDQIRFFLGHSGWGPGQLDNELKRNTWVVTEAPCSLLMKTRSHQMWNLLLQRMGPEYDLWRNFPANPDFN